MNKKTVVVASVVSTLILCNTNSLAFATDVQKSSIFTKSEVNNIKNDHKLVSYENIRINSNSETLDISNQIENFKNLEEGTLVARFRGNDDNLSSLIGISNKNQNNTYFHLYKSGSRIGVEIRDEDNNLNKNIYADVTLNDGFNTVAFKVEKNKSYSLYLNGNLVKEELTNDTKFLNDIMGINNAYIGKTSRLNGNQYLFNGDIDFIDIYDNPVSKSYLIDKTSETKTPNENDFLPENAYKSDVENLFAPGVLNSNAYRIPSLFTTKSGTVLASIDARIDNASDAPNNIDTAIKRSEDGGKTWDDGKIILDYPEKSSAIDTSMLQDEESGRIFLLVTHFASEYGFPNAKTGSGYKEINGIRYLQLFDSNNNEYTVRKNGIVYDSKGNITRYHVDKDNNLYKNNKKVDNILTSTSPLKVLGTSFLSMIYSDDDGKTWSKPIDLNKDVKADWMRFLGTSPGKGHQIKNGKYTGRLVFPIYLTNSNGFQSSGAIYSDDNGKTWSIGETVTDGRDMGDGQIGNAQTQTSGEQLTECQVVEMPNGQLKMFMRNTGDFVKIATSFDGGQTWDSNVIEDRNLREPYCQLSVINYSKKIDGKPAIIFSNPNSTSRSNGTVRVGLISENGTYENGEPKYEFEWKYNKLVKPGYFAYSCLTELPNNNIGLFYEGTDSKEMSYIDMNLDYLKFNLDKESTSAKIKEVTILDKNKSYSPNDKLKIKLKFDQNISIMGKRNIKVKINNKEIELKMTRYNESNEVIFEGTIPNGIKTGKYDLILKSNKDLEIINIFNQKTLIDKDINTFEKIKIKKK